MRGWGRLWVQGALRAFPLARPRVVAARWLVLLAGIAGLGFWRYTSSQNLALHKPIRMSSNCMSRPWHSYLPVEAPRLVDGKTWRPYDACTLRERRPWVLLDLESATRIDSVVITGRSDCCWGYADLPLVLEVSDDDEGFTEVGRRVLPLSDRDPWRLDLDGARGRYLRIRVDGNRHAQIVLAEIEVYGAPLNL
jgi:hypothetical protein